MKSVGLGINIYSSHSTRAARTSSCKAKVFSVEEIMKVAGWSNSGIFATFYQKKVACLFIPLSLSLLPNFLCYR